MNQSREDAVRQIYEKYGLNKIIEFANTVKYPRYVAFGLAQILQSASEFNSVLGIALNENEKLEEFTAILSAEGARKFGLEWQNLILARKASGKITLEQIAKLLLAWPDEPATWTFADTLGVEVDRAYWTNKPIWAVRGNDTDLEFAAKKYLGVGRAIAAIEILYPKAERVSASVLLEALDKAINEINESPKRASSNYLFEVGEVFDALGKRSDVSATELARREYAYLPLLRFRDKALKLHQIMVSDPSFFVSIICDAFKRASGDAEEVTEERQRRARAGYELLSTLELTPGGSGSTIDFSQLRSWVVEVRELAAKEDRASIGDEFIGHILARAPVDPDGAWPHRAVRDLLEELKSTHVEQGISIERFNMRGGFSKAIYEGGGQERGLSEQAREWAKATTAWPRTHALLLEIADSWDRWAQREDERARQDEMRFEQ